VTLFVVRLALTVLGILVFRLSLGPKIAIAGVQPDLAAALVFYLSLIRGPTMGIVAGFVLGLLIDVDDPAGLGVTSLAWCTMAYVTVRLASAIDLTDRLVSSAMLFVLVLVAETIRALVVSSVDPTRFALIWIRWGVPTALYTAVAVPLLLAAGRAILGGSRWLRGEP
jgi:rod shape-determining protein MreD